MIDIDNYDCTQCGACCVSDFDSVDYVHLLEQDIDRMTDDEQERFIYVEQTYGKSQSSMRTCRDRKGNCRCAALTGEIGVEVACSIYERRPNVCRNFEPGTDICDYARQQVFGMSLK